VYVSDFTIADKHEGRISRFGTAIPQTIYVLLTGRKFYLAQTEEVNKGLDLTEFLIWRRGLIYLPKVTSTSVHFPRRSERRSPTIKGRRREWSFNSYYSMGNTLAPRFVDETQRSGDLCHPSISIN
jgi:hypothetical protein